MRFFIIVTNLLSRNGRSLSYLILPIVLWLQVTNCLFFLFSFFFFIFFFLSNYVNVSA